MAAAVSLETGLQFARDKQYDKAINEFTSLLSQDQNFADAFFYRGCAYLHLGQYKKAIDDFSSAISSGNLSSKHEPSAFYKRGYAYYKINQFDSALDDYRYFLNYCKNDQEQKYLHKGHFQMGVIYAALNKNSEAILHFDKAIQLSTGTEEDEQKLYYLHLGRAYACDAKYEKALENLRWVVKKSTDSFVKGCAYNELGQHQDALTEFENLLESNGNESKLVRTYHDHILFRQGLSCASRNLHVQALNHFQSALDHSKRPSSSNITDRILFRKGMSNIALNYPRKALIDFNDSTKLNDNQSDVFYARGILQYKLGRHDAAVHDQRKAIELGRKSPSVAPIYKTFYHTDKHGDNYNYYNYYENKIHEAKKLLEKNKGTPKEPIILHEIIRYLEKQASCSDDPLQQYKSAHEDIMNARGSSYKSSIENSILLAINSFQTAQCLSDKYLTQEMPENVIEQYINRAVESILCMSDLFDQCVIEQNWRELVAALEAEAELRKANVQHVHFNDIISIRYINDQLQRIETIKKTMALFADSRAQQEFYGLLIIRLWNLFDGVRSASTGIFSHALKGTCTKVSWAFKLLGKLFEFVPIGSQYGSKVFGLCESGLQQLDEKRIQNALKYLGDRCDSGTANKIADAIVTELTKMYKTQLERFPTKKEEEDAANNNNNNQQQPNTLCSKCARFFRRQKNCCLNDMELSTMETLVEYGASLALSCLIRLEVKDIEPFERIQNVFINGICRPSKLTVFHIMKLADKIKPKDAKNDKERWDTYDFFRRPAIDFENGTIRAQKETDMEKFGCRKATSDEKDLLKTKPEEFDKFGFKITIKIDNSS
jgi:tetratricopeptide (TPR) repeat protein